MHYLRKQISGYTQTDTVIDYNHNTKNMKIVNVHTKSLDCRKQYDYTWSVNGKTVSHELETELESKLDYLFENKLTDTNI